MDLDPFSGAAFVFRAKRADRIKVLVWDQTGIVLAEENARLKACLAETETALADAVEAQKRLESIVSELRRDKFGRKSEKLDPEPFNLPLEDIPACRPKVGPVMPDLRSCAPADRDIEVAQGVLEAAQEKARDALKGKGAGEGSRWIGRRSVLAVAARWPGSARI